MLPPHKRFWMTSPQQDTSDEMMTEAIFHSRLHLKLDARSWTFIVPRFHAWREHEGSPSTFKLGESSSATQILPVIDHLEDITLERVKVVEQELEILRNKVEAIEQQIKVLHDSLWIERDRITKLKSMSTTRQGLSSTTIEQLIAQYVDDALTAYEANRNNINGANNETSRSVGGVEHAVRSCCYKEFLACKPHNFNETKGVVCLTLSVASTKLMLPVEVNIADAS
nr:hypothetical protein [Tanacetum cinerariifolium]